MMNAAPNVCSANPTVGIPASGSAAPNATDEMPFAQALDQAAARQRAASGDAAPGADTDTGQAAAGEPAA
ncbi:MAG TPA: hypothetical protein VET87_22525, partial [Rubrivivax sp.]|nr:hypothetical protein [Rubrivivax sp.]